MLRRKKPQRNGHRGEKRVAGGQEGGREVCKGDKPQRERERDPTKTPAGINQKQ